VLILCVVHAAIRREALPAVSASNMTVGELVAAMQLAREVEQARLAGSSGGMKAEGQAASEAAADENITSLSSARHTK
jgi:hypothetical protein